MELTSETIIICENKQDVRLVIRSAYTQGYSMGINTWTAAEEIVLSVMYDWPRCIRLNPAQRMDLGHASLSYYDREYLNKARLPASEYLAEASTVSRAEDVMNCNSEILVTSLSPSELQAVMRQTVNYGELSTRIIDELCEKQRQEPEALLAIRLGRPTPNGRSFMDYARARDYTDNTDLPTTTASEYLIAIRVQNTLEDAPTRMYRAGHLGEVVLIGRSVDIMISIALACNNIDKSEARGLRHNMEVRLGEEPADADLAIHLGPQRGSGRNFMGWDVPKCYAGRNWTMMPAEKFWKLIRPVSYTVGPAITSLPIPAGESQLCSPAMVADEYMLLLT